MGDASGYRMRHECKDGEYEGLVSGSHLVWKDGDVDVDVHLKRYVKGINLPVSFTIKDGMVEESSIKASKKCSPEN